MTNNKPKGIKIDPTRLQIQDNNSDLKTIFPKQPKDKK